MLWNELSYEEQTKVLDRISTLVEQESSYNTKKGLVAALNELDLWSNSPCPEYRNIETEDAEIPCFLELDGAVSATSPCDFD